MKAIIISRPTVNACDDLEPELRLENGRLTLELRAFRALRVVEIQGSRSLLKVFNAEKPSNFQTRMFGDETEVPPEMRDDVAFMNRTNFRWACDIAIAEGNAATVSIPSKMVEGPPPLDLSTVSVVYEYKRYFGLMRKKFSTTIAVGDRKDRGQDRGALNA